MILLDDIVQVLDRSMPTTAAKRPFLLYSQDGRGIDRRLIRVDDARLRMRQIAQSLAKQALGSIGIAERRQQEINRGACRIDRSIQVAPAALHPNVGLVDTPRPVGRFEMTSYALVEFRAIPLHPAPYGRVARQRSSSNSSTSRNESEYRRYQRTAHRMSWGSVCRHLKIAGL